MTERDFTEKDRRLLDQKFESVHDKLDHLEEIFQQRTDEKIERKTEANKQRIKDVSDRLDEHEGDHAPGLKILTFVWGVVTTIVGAAVYLITMIFNKG